MTDQEILDNAPETSSHYVDGRYLRLCETGANPIYWDGKWYADKYELRSQSGVRKLSDIRQLVEKDKRIAELEAKLNECHQMILSNCYDDVSASGGRLMEFAESINPFNRLPQEVKESFRSTYECPKCKQQFDSGGDIQSIWCGKNLMCGACGEFSYYNEYTVKD